MEAWIAEVLGRVEAKLQEGIAQGEATAARAGEVREQLDGKAAEARAVVATRGEAVAAKEASLAEAAQEVTAAKARQAEAESVRSRGQAKLTQTAKEKDELQEALQPFAALLKDEVTFDAAKARRYANKLAVLAKKLQLDESLVSGLAPVCGKAPSARGKFDNLVIEKLEQGIQCKLDEVTGMFEVSSLAARDCTTVIDGAKEKVAAAEAAQQGIQGELASAQAELGEASKLLSEAEAAIGAFVAEQETFAATQGKRVEALQNFRAYNLGCLSELRGQAKAEKAAPDSKAENSAPDARAMPQTGGA